MTGIRVSNIPLGATEKDLKIYFSNPKNGGGKVTRIYYPLPGNEAVLFFQDSKVVTNAFSGTHGIKGKIVMLKALPRRVFSKVTVELDQSITHVLDENSSYLDELQFDGDLEVTFDPDSMNYIMSGDWYQIEWAYAYLDKVCSKLPNMNTIPDVPRSSKTPPNRIIDDSTPSKNEVNKTRDKIRKRSDSSEEFDGKLQLGAKGEFDFESKWKSATTSENENISGMWCEEKKPAKQNITNKMSDSNIIGATAKSVPKKRTEGKQSFNNDLSKSLTQVSKERKPEFKNLFARREKTEFNVQKSSRKRDPYAIDDEYEQVCAGGSNPNNVFSDYHGSFSDDDNWFEPSNANIPPYRSLTQVGQRRSNPWRQQGMSVSHSDFGDIPLTLEIYVDSLKVLVNIGDIIEETTDAIVNPCSTDLMHTYGISKAIAIAAGNELQEECRKYISKKGHLVFGDVIHTCAGGMLNKRVGFVVHAAGPAWRNDQNEQSAHILTCTYLNCFQYANKQLWLRSISLPLIGAGAYGCPLDVSVQAFYDALLLHVTDDKQPRHLREIHLVSNDPDSTCAIIVVLRSLMDLDQTQSKNAAVERYQTRSIQFEFTANRFDTGVEPSGDTGQKDEERSSDESEKDHEPSVKEESDAEGSDKNDDQELELSNSDKDRVNIGEDDKFQEEMSNDIQSNDESELLIQSEDNIENTSLTDEYLSHRELEKEPVQDTYDDDVVPIGLIDVANIHESDKSGNESESETTDVLDKQADITEITGNNKASGFSDSQKDKMVEESVAKVSVNEMTDKEIEPTE